MKLKEILICVILFFNFLAKANNVAITNVTLSGQVSASDYTMVEFDIDWDNSFRITAGGANWDAVWVFAKYQVTGGSGCTAASTWYHATLSATSGDHSITTDNGTAGTITSVSDGKGVFMYRSATGSGSINWDDVKLRWNYGTDGLADGCSVTVKIFAIEMVYVPTGGFYCGDGTGGTINGQFESAVSGSPFQVTSATTPATLGGGGAGSMGNNNASGQSGGADDFNDATSKALPNTYPNGYNKFYMMKHEVSQEEYKEFLNTLNGTQQAARASNISVGNYFCATNTQNTPQSRNGIKCKVAPSGATAGEYVCDLDNDGTFNETSGDGRYIACNWLSWPDLAAFLDWACLRPMTDMELEKAGRGPLLPVANEYSWGSTSITYAAAVSNGGSDNELVTTASANCCSNGSFATGPVRCGVFATGTSTRAQAGASYYGVMELTGNVWENPVNLGNVAGRAFQDVNGNGVLNSNGQADVNYWPGINGNSTLTAANSTYGGTTGVTGYAGIGFRSGTWNSGGWLRLSDREYATYGLTTRDTRNGGRGVRTAP